MDTSVKIAKLQHQASLANAARDVILGVIDNPVADLLIGYLILDYVASQRPGTIHDNVMRLFSEGALVTICTAKAIAPALRGEGSAAALAARFLK